MLWIDSKLKNYELCVDYYQKKQRITHASILPILIVEKRTIMDKILELWAGERKKKTEKGEGMSLFTPEKPTKKVYKVLLKRPLSEEERLLRELNYEPSEDDIELDLKKNFYYVINPEGKVIDCAKIYSFLHENNIYQRIMAKVAQDIDSRMEKLTHK